MSKRDKHSLPKRIGIDIAGFGLIILAPLLGWLPGPGGIPMIIAGLGILSLNYDWAERLLKNFDNMRKDFTEKYLVGNRKISITIDLLSSLIILLAVFAVLYIDATIMKFLSVGVGTFALFILISNQRRLDRTIKWLRRPKHKHK